MTDDVQTLQRSPDDSGTDLAAHEAESTTEPMEETSQARRRKRFRPDEIALANKFKNLAPIGEPIEFSSLDMELKRAVLPNRRARLIDRGVLEVDYDEETGLLKTVSINAEMFAEYEWDLTPIPEAKLTKLTALGEPRKRRPRNLLADTKYRISLIAESNPKKPGTHSYFNWQECYHDGQSIPDYLSQMDYPRMIITSKGTYFNGPSTLFIEQDLKAGHIGIYDSTLPTTLEDGSANPAIWIKFEDLNRIMDEAPDDTDEESETADSGESPV